MRVHRSLLSIAIGVICFLSFSSVSTAHTYATSHDTAPCTTGTTAYNVQAGVKRSSGPYQAVRATAKIVDLLPCYNPTSTSDGMSLVNVANARCNGCGSFAQFGYIKAVCSVQPCQGGLTSQQEDFWWTPADNNGGGIAQASWITALDGNLATHDLPRVGDKYRFSIEETAVGLLKHWMFCIEVIASTTYQLGTYQCESIDRHSNNGFNEATWAVEIHNDASALGHRATGTAINITPLQYMFSNGSIYSTVTGAACYWAGDTKDPANICSITGGSGTSTLDVYTQVHT